MTLPSSDVDPDTASIEAIVSCLYDVLSGPAGERDWDRLRKLYLEGARLIPTGARPGGRQGLNLFPVEAYIQDVRPHFRANGFHEREVARRIERFGEIAHVFSTYESRHRAEDPEPFVRGINSIQLLRREGRWWVVNVLWQNESDDAPIPARYLPAAVAAES